MKASKPAAGYSADTQVLTRRGWVRFPDIEKWQDEFATRNPETGIMEWQQATRFHEASFDGELVNFHSRTLDLLVAPDHGVLVTRKPRGMDAQAHGDGWIIRAADVTQRFSNRQRVLLTARNVRPDLERFVVPSTDTAYNEYVVFDPAVLKPARKRLGIRLVDVAALAGCSYTTAQKIDNGGTCRLRLAERISRLLGDVPFAEHSTKFAFTEMSGDDFAAFMGMWLSEGCVSWTSTPVKRPCIYVTQHRQSRGFEPYRDLLARLLAREPGYDGHSFFVRHVGLAAYLEQFGYSRDKFLPPEILNLSARQAEIFWHYYWLGDGTAGRQRIITGSRQMADDLQVLAMHMGKWATFHRRMGKGDIVLPQGTIQREVDRKPVWVIALHEFPAACWQSRKVPHCGTVYCVSVPNSTLYVRRDRKPAWAVSV